MKKVIAKDKLPALWERLAGEGKLYVPVEEGPVVMFKPWEEGIKVDLEQVNTAVPPKDLFLPREETFMQYYCDSYKIKIDAVETIEDMVLFGIHPCDLKAVEMLDKVFIEGDPPDELYRERREKTTVVALACSEPDPYCFCNLFSIDPQEAPGADVVAGFSDDSLIMESQTGKGENLLKLAADLLEDGTNLERKKEEVKTTDFGLDLKGLGKDLKDRFDDPVWDELYQACLGCGTCTYVCPTCYCFDVEDFGHEYKGVRFRCWDSCMYGHFTIMAGGHNPRPSQKERVRQRFLHKLQYYPEAYGETACVGCGRCLRNCPVNLDIVQAIKALGGESVEQR
ncbi:MAG: 4Fe-4S dicluster domain-containing protein [Bacillota bacterium]